MSRRLRALGDFTERHTIGSDNSNNAIWNEILKFSDYRFVSSIWEEGSQNDFVYITMAVSQAYEYYKASKVVSLNTKPLLLYYSFLNLTKAFLYLENEKKPSEYHGLSNFIENQDIHNCKVTTNNGVFLELAKLVNFEIPAKREIYFKDFCSNAIEVFWDYEQYFNKKTEIHIS